MKIKYLLAASAVSLSAAFAPTAAVAQSTGSVDFNSGEIVVTGSRATDVGGIEVPPTTKAQQVLDEEIIRRQRPGQTVNDIVNLVPGVSFQNNDPWGAGGGSFTIRGFSSDRISQTVDGIPLNDSGNYALYTNQQQDPETLESINVNLGSTDVDSPTASASGGTINIRTREPDDQMGVTATMTVGSTFANGDDGRSRLYMRGFGMIDTGDFTGFGTKAFVAASYARYNNPFNNYGVNEKTQLNGRIWQDIGSNGDFVAVAGHFNRNHNNFFGSLPLRADPSIEVGPDISQRFPQTRPERFYEINWPCTVDQPEAGVADKTNKCGTEFDRRYNPSDTGNIRGASRFTLMDGLTLTLDPSYQWVKANGGGTVTGLEQGTVIGGQTYYGYIGNKYYVGTDLNGDGDTLDQVTVIAPSQTRTKRYGVISNLIWEINPDHLFRVSYTLDHANHRQTGQLGYVASNGEPLTVFPVDAPILDANGNVVQKRDRQSYAILNQLSGEYKGHFGGLTVDLGLRSPWFKRDLNQYCFTTSAAGFVDCISSGDMAAYGTANAGKNNGLGYSAPQQRIYKYHKVLPNVGLTYELGNAALFANYSQGLQVPGTDNLYQSVYYPASNPDAQPAPETTDNFDLGARVRRGKLQAQVSLWYTKYKNRLASAYDPILDVTVYRNLGKVDKYGIDGSVSWEPTRNLMLYAFASYLHSEIQDDVLGGKCTTSGLYECVGGQYFLQTAGKRESGAPVYTFGGRAQYSVGAFEFGVQAKRTGKRYINDENRPIFASRDKTASDPTNFIYGATTPAYTLVDLDARWNISSTPWGKEVALQLNVTNLFDKLYVGGFTGNATATNLPFVQIGAPRAASLSLVIGY